MIRGPNGRDGHDYVPSNANVQCDYGHDVNASNYDVLLRAHHYVRCSE